MRHLIIQRSGVLSFIESRSSGDISTWYSAAMKRISELADVSQGLAVSGRGAGARSGDWELRLAESADIADDRLEFEASEASAFSVVPARRRTCCAPYDVLVTARSQAVKVALVPPAVSRTAAGVTLLVLRPIRPESGNRPLALVCPHVTKRSVGSRASIATGHVASIAASVGAGRSRDSGSVGHRATSAGQVDRNLGVGVSSGCGRGPATPGKTLRDSLIQYFGGNVPGTR